METTALGAAYAAARAIDAWPKHPKVQSTSGGTTWKPRMPATQRKKLYERWLAAVERSLGWAS